MRIKLLILLVGIAVIAGGAIAVYFVAIKDKVVYDVEFTDYKAPNSSDDEQLADDRLEDKKPAFDEAVVDRRPIGDDRAWLLNASAAVIRLDVPPIQTDHEDRLLTLYPSYADTFQHGSDAIPVLPSLNLLDGKAKQFDDGLYAALDLAYYQGLTGKLPGHVQLIERLAERVGKNSPAAAYLSAGLELAGVKIDIADQPARESLLADFRAEEAASKPIGFYTWNDELEKLFRFMRFFQHEFKPGHKRDLEIVQALVAALTDDKQLAADYQQAVDFYSRLTNPGLCLSLADLSSTAQINAATLTQLAQKLHRSHETIAVFPPSTSKEVVLFEDLFPMGVPPDIDLMKELVRRIRSGEVNLKPRADSGWYDYQVYALEALLLPEKGAEKDKLLMTKAYKKRMIEAFKALITKRRETHVRELGIAGAKTTAAKPPDQFGPPLRVEPCPTYYLRTARAYAFLSNFLEASVGKDKLAILHGLKKDGQRAPGLHTELMDMRDLFYGLYLVSAEDIGLKPDITTDEPVSQDHCYHLATSWLKKVSTDPDLLADTRVAVPIFVDQIRGVTRLWVTLGVRLAKLEAGYARPPSIKPANGEGAWHEAEPHQLKNAQFLIPVDEFADFELKGNQVLSREELRAICDREKTKEAIVHALRER
jgi:hypothetical protein